MSPTSILAPASTPVFWTVIAVFVAVFALLVYAVVAFRSANPDDRIEPPQIYGSTQVELAWTVIPILIVVALFLATARVIASIQNPPHPASALEVIVLAFCRHRLDRRFHDRLRSGHLRRSIKICQTRSNYPHRRRGRLCWRSE
jgi:hypothetical protein